MQGWSIIAVQELCDAYQDVGLMWRSSGYGEALVAVSLSPGSIKRPSGQVGSPIVIDLCLSVLDWI
jgi:hypothetical protein